MKFLIDVQQDKLRAKITQFPDLVCGQLITPLTGYRNWGGRFAIDNGAFSGFQQEKFLATLRKMEPHKAECLFVCCPDVVGAGRRTIEIWSHRSRWLAGWPAALVLQNGIEDLDIPWSECSAVFIGGVDPWKESQACADLVKTAKTLGLWVHVGRVNTFKRFHRFKELGADSCDGSGVAMYDYMLEDIARMMASGEGRKNEKTLFDGHAEGEEE